MEEDNFNNSRIIVKKAEVWYRLFVYPLSSATLTHPLTRGAPLLSFNADGIFDISPVLRGNYPLGKALFNMLIIDL